MSPLARKLLSTMSPQEKVALQLKVSNPIAAIKYLVDKHGAKFIIAREIVASFKPKPEEENSTDFQSENENND